MKKEPANVHDNLAHHLNKKLIPWAGSEALQIVLMQPPFRVADEVSVTPVRAPLLKNKTNSPGAVAKWPAEAMNARHYVGLCCIVEGKVDWSVGVTRRMTQIFPQLDTQHGRYVLRLPPQSFLVMPPGVPFNDGSQPHWFGEDEETPDSLIFWISCTPQGADLHLCRTLNGVHKSLFPAFVQDDHILRVAELLLEDLQKTSPQLTATAHHYLSAILLRVLYALQSDRQHAPMQQLFPPVESHHDEAGAESGGEALLAERACRFIQTRLITQLTVQQIADHLYVSPSHLNRVFKRQMGVSPMKYVTQRRMEIARTMLLNTKYPILYISNFFGYSHPDVFSRAFKESFGVSPKKFRRRV